MKKVLLILLSMTFILLLPSMTYADTTIGNANLNVKYNLSTKDFYGRTYTPYCLYDCDMPIPITIAGTLKPSTICPSDLAWAKSKIIGADNIGTITFEYLSNVSHSYSNYITDSGCSYNYTDHTFYDCAKPYWSNGTWYSMDWLPLKGCVDINNVYAINLHGRRNSIKSSAIDVVPSVLSLPMSNLAWWNTTSYSYARIINITTYSEALDTRYTVNLTNLDTTNTSSYASNCQALRVIWGNTTEVDRVINGCGTAETSLEFRLLYNISTNTKDYNYSLVYYNTTQINPAMQNWNNTYWFAETCDAVNLTKWTNTSGQILIANNVCKWATTADSYLNSTGSVFDKPFSVEFLNLNYTNGASFLVARQLTGNNGTDARGGLYTEGTGNNWTWFMIDNSPSSGNATAWLWANPKNRTFKVFNISMAQYFQNGALTTNVPYNINFPLMWISFRDLGTNTLFFTGIRVRKITAEANNPAVSFGAETYIGGTSETVNLTINGGVGNMTQQYTATSINITSWSSITGYWVAIARNGTLLVNTSNSATTNTVLPAGYWNITAFSNSSSATLWVNITKVPTSVNLTIDGGVGNITRGYSYTLGSNLTAWANTTGMWVGIAMNGTLLSNGTLSVTTQEIFGALVYNITAFYSGNENYSASSSVLWANITQASIPIWICSRNTTGEYCGNSMVGVLFYGGDIRETYPNPVNVTAVTLLSDPQLPSYLFQRYYLNGTYSYFNNVTNASNYQYNATSGSQAWAVFYNFSSNTNYTANYSKTNIYISQGVPVINITFNTSSSVSAGTPVLVTCNKPSDLATVNLYNDTGSVSNPFTFNTTGLTAGDYNFTCNTTGNANYTGATTNNTLTVSLIGALIISHVYDENNLSKTLTFDIQIYNSTYSASSNGITTYNNNEVRGDLVVIISCAGYGTRRYYISIPAEGIYTMDAYLVNSTVGQYVTMTTKNYIEFPIESVNIDILRLLASNWTTVSQGQTDGSGVFVFFLDPNQNYKVNIWKTGYNDINTSLIPVLTSYTFHLLTGETNVPSYWDFYKNLSGSCSFNNTTRILTCPWSDVSGHLTSVSLIVTKRNITASWTLCNNTSTASSGTFTCSFGTPNNNSFLWYFRGYTSSDPSSLMLASGSWIDSVLFSIGVTGLFLAFLIVLVCSFIGVQIQNPVFTIIMTLLGVGVSFLFGLIDMPGTLMTLFIGLAVSGGLLIYKMR